MTLSRPRPATLVPLMVWLAGCVTVNIYFPAAAAEKAADRIIENVWGPQGAQQPAAPGAAPGTRQPPPATPSAPGGTSRAPESSSTWAGTVLAILVPPAYGAQPNFDISTPGIQRLEASMRQRYARLEPYYRSGAVGLARDGGVALRDPGAVSLKQRNAVRQLVAEENADRSALYREIARANGHPEWEDEIRATFARRWVDKAPRGWWYQDASGAWHQK